jgi:signal recognition particle protein
VATHAEDAQERTATHFAAGLPFEECLHVFAAVGVDMGHLEGPFGSRWQTHP